MSVQVTQPTLDGLNSQLVAQQGISQSAAQSKAAADLLIADLQAIIASLTVAP